MRVVKDHPILVDFTHSVRSVLYKANCLYGRPFNWADSIDIHFDDLRDTGTVAFAAVKPNSVPFLVFDIECVFILNSRMKSEVIPHEVAHIVGFKFPETGIKNHNRAWQFVDSMLGGVGKELF